MPGQIDAADLAGAAVRALTDTLPAIAVDVVLGAASPHVQAFRGRRNVTLHVDIDAGEVALLMRDADLAIGAGGGGSWERCALGLPSVIAVVSDNQRAVAAELERSQVAIVAAQNPDAIAAAIGRLTPARLADMSRRARALCDGRGTFRTAVALVPAERTISRKELRLRPAEQADAALLLDWQSHPDTRRFARNPDVPSESHHEAWLQAKLADPDSLFTLVVENSTPVASLRLDRVDQDYEISIVVAPGRRHSGIGRGALALARRLVPKRRLVGFVADANTASQRLFSSSGYLRQADGYFVHDG
jgi:RimJ/RimL family protein N-acetyltransferase